MPANPNKTPSSVPGCKAPPTRCSATTAAGRPCRAYAVHGSDPPRCSAHLARNTGAGAPAGNQNARKHGFYSPMISIRDLVDLAECGDQITLDAEVACARIVLRGLLGQLRDLDAREHGDYARLAGLALQAARTIAHLLRDKHALVGDPSVALSFITEILDQLRARSGTEPESTTDDR